MLRKHALAALLAVAAVVVAMPVLADKPPKNEPVSRWLVVLRDNGADVSTIAAEIARSVDGAVYELWHEPGNRPGGRRFTIGMTEKDARSLNHDKRVQMIMRDDKAPKASSLSVQSDARGEVGSQNHEDNERHWTVWYQYDGSGNVVTARESTYFYDPVGRVSTAWVAPVGAQSYAYDSFGNMTRINVEWPETYERLMPADVATNRLQGAQYDGSGNVTSWSGVNYSYDGADMMKTLQSATRSLAYLYTADDERIAMVDQLNHRTSWRLRGFENTVLTEYVQSQVGGQSQWTWDKDYIYRDASQLAAVSPRGTDHFHLNHLDSTYWITDSTGSYTAVHDYLPYGEEGSSILQNTETLKFTGHERDYLGSGFTENLDYLDYMHARYYFPALGRFLSADREEPDFFNPRTMNLYSYADGNPLARVDRSGKANNYFTFTFRKEEFRDKKQSTDYMEYVGVLLDIDKRTATRDKFAKGLADPEGLSFYVGHMNVKTGELKFNVPNGTDVQSIFNLTNNNRVLCIATCNSAAFLGKFKLQPGQAIIGVSSNAKDGVVIAGDLQYIGTQIQLGIKQGKSLPDIVKRLNDYYSDPEKRGKDPKYRVKIVLREEPAKGTGDKKKDEKKKQ